MRIITAPFRALWALLKKIGRIALWVVFWPVGLWRSIRHGRKKQDAALRAELRKLRDAA